MCAIDTEVEAWFAEAYSVVVQTHVSRQAQADGSES
jgi:hypothetical protein